MQPISQYSNFFSMGLFLITWEKSIWDVRRKTDKTDNQFAVCTCPSYPSHVSNILVSPDVKQNLNCKNAKNSYLERGRISLQNHISTRRVVDTYMDDQCICGLVFIAQILRFDVQNHKIGHFEKCAFQKLCVQKKTKQKLPFGQN